MKKIYTLLALTATIFITSCAETPNGTSTIKTNDNYNIKTIDGCEYIEVENSAGAFNNYAYSLTHKGNCKNPIHTPVATSTKSIDTADLIIAQGEIMADQETLDALRAKYGKAKN